MKSDTIFSTLFLIIFSIITIHFILSSNIENSYIIDTTQNITVTPSQHYSARSSSIPSLTSPLTSLTPASLLPSVTTKTSTAIIINSVKSSSIPSLKPIRTTSNIITSYSDNPTKISLFTPSPSISPTTPQTVTHDPWSIQNIINEWPVPSSADQIILVTGDGSSAAISMFNKNNTDWIKIMTSDGYAGKNGVGQASESSYYSPRGVFSLTKAFGISPDPGTVLPYIQVNNSHYWIDDPASKYYNQLISIENTEKDWMSAEHLTDMQIEYKYSIVIDYNLECIPGAGSAFFLHCESGAATAGCIAIPESKMLFILKNISENSFIIILDKNDIH